jgi:hypothetical protein
MKKGKLPPAKTPSLVMREVSVVASTADATRRSVRVVTATETPVLRYDDERGMVVKEVLLMDGMRMRPGRTQLPIVDSHDQSTIRNVVGSLRNVNVDGDEFGGDAYFASDAASQEAYAKLSEGHLTDFSITAEPLETRFVQRGETYRTTAGNVIEGPANIVLSWTPLDASLVACGADNYSTVRRSYLEAARKESSRMIDAQVLAALQAKGLPEGMEDPNQILAWVAGMMGSEAAKEAGEVSDEMASLPVEPVEASKREVMEDKPVEDATEPVAKTMDVEEEVKRHLTADAKRRKTIIQDCKLAKLERAFADELCDSGLSVEDARERILRKMSTKEIGQTVGGAEIKVTASEDDKFNAAVRDGLLIRSYQGARVQRHKVDNPAAGANDFARLSLNRLAYAVLSRAGYPVERMSNREIAMAAMGNRSISERYIKRSESYHTTGSFTNLLLDAANKTLLAAYDEAIYSWSQWARQAPSVEDFKAINRIRFGESPNLEMVPEGKEYPEKSVGDSKESYSVQKYGALFTVSWETVVNDDLDAISRIPAMHGNAARRMQNKKVYEVLTSNPTMGDGYSLFSSSHASGDNTSGSAAAPAVATLSTGFEKMMLQKGISSDAILGIVPRFLIVPANYSAEALQLMASTADPAAGGSAAGNANTANIYGPGGARSLNVIVEPQLDGASTTNWYLAADPAQIDTVELCFLSGEESPVLESEWDFATDTYKYKVRQTFGVKAIDWRGLFRNSA